MDQFQFPLFQSLYYNERAGKYILMVMPKDGGRAEFIDLANVKDRSQFEAKGNSSLRLEEKGYVSHTVDGRTYVYQATEARGRVAARAVQRVVDWFCNGSVEEVLVGMVDTAMLDRKRLRMLTDRIAQEKGKK